MTTQTHATQGGSTRQMLAACGMGMALVVLIGLAGWKTFGTAGPAATAPTSLSPIPTSSTSHSAAQARPAVTASTDETIYLVNTPEQADTLRARLTAAASLTAQSGTTLPGDRIVVLSGTEQEQLLLHTIDDLAAHGVRVVDLRALGRSSTAAATAPFATPPVETWFLVGRR
jgi:hypothetical protein